MPAQLYTMRISHPAKAAELMLERKGVEYQPVVLQPGEQAVRARVARFRGGTVPALAIDGRRVAGSRAIARVLDELQPEPPLFPRDPARRRAVEAAEEWGEHVLQPIPRRLLRWALMRNRAARVEFVRGLGNPRPELAAHVMGPVAAFYARRESAWRTEQIRSDWERLPAHLDHVDELIAEGTIGDGEPNAADFQIATTLRVMLACADFAPHVEGRPGEALARGIWPDYPFAVPSLLPADLAA